jgi:hypothetical protein
MFSSFQFYLFEKKNQLYCNGRQTHSAEGCRNPAELNAQKLAEQKLAKQIKERHA